MANSSSPSASSLSSSWSVDELRENAKSWSLEGDSQLLEYMKSISKNLENRYETTTTNINKMLLNLNESNIYLGNTTNKLLSLSHSKFVENRVYEEDETITKVKNDVGVCSGVGAGDDVTDSNNKTNDKKNKVLSSVETLQIIVNNGLKMMDKCYKKIELDLKDSDDDDDDDVQQNSGGAAAPGGADKIDNKQNSVIFVSKNPYHNRPLPFLIGSKEWKEKWHIGLVESDDEKSENDMNEEEFSGSSEVDDDDDRFSESAVSLPSNTQTMSESECSAWGLNTSHQAYPKPDLFRHSSEEDLSITPQPNNKITTARKQFPPSQPIAKPRQQIIKSAKESEQETRPPLKIREQQPPSPHTIPSSSSTSSSSSLAQPSVNQIPKTNPKNLFDDSDSDEFIASNSNRNKSKQSTNTIFRKQSAIISTTTTSGLPPLLNSEPPEIDFTINNAKQQTANNNNNNKKPTNLFLDSDDDDDNNNFFSTMKPFTVPVKKVEDMKNNKKSTSSSSSVKSNEKEKQNERQQQSETTAENQKPTEIIKSSKNPIAAPRLQKTVNLFDDDNDDDDEDFNNLIKELDKNKIDDKKKTETTDKIVKKTNYLNLFDDQPPDDDFFDIIISNKNKERISESKNNIIDDHKEIGNEKKITNDNFSNEITNKLKPNINLESNKKDLLFDEQQHKKADILNANIKKITKLKNLFDDDDDDESDLFGSLSINNNDNTKKRLITTENKPIKSNEKSQEQIINNINDPKLFVIENNSNTISKKSNLNDLFNDESKKPDIPDDKKLFVSEHTIDDRDDDTKSVSKESNLIINDIENQPNNIDKNIDVFNDGDDVIIKNTTVDVITTSANENTTIVSSSLNLFDNDEIIPDDDDDDIFASIKQKNVKDNQKKLENLFDVISKNDLSIPSESEKSERDDHLFITDTLENQIKSDGVEEIIFDNKSDDVVVITGKSDIENTPAEINNSFENIDEPGDDDLFGESSKTTPKTIPNFLEYDDTDDNNNDSIVDYTQTSTIKNSALNYPSIPMFADIPPDDDDNNNNNNNDEDNDDFLTNTKTIVSNIFYDDFAETIVNEKANAPPSTTQSPSTTPIKTTPILSNTTGFLFNDEPPPDDDNDNTKLPNDTNEFTDVNNVILKEPPSVESVVEKPTIVNDEKTKKCLIVDVAKKDNKSLISDDEVQVHDEKPPTPERRPIPKKLNINLNINVAALLPGAKRPTMMASNNNNNNNNNDSKISDAENSTETIVTKKEITDTNVTNITPSSNSVSISTATITPTKSNIDDNTGRLQSLNKSRPKISVQRKPSSRQARHIQYQRTLLDDDDADADDADTANTESSIDKSDISKENLLNDSNADEEIKNNDSNLLENNQKSIIKKSPTSKHETKQDDVDDDENDWLLNADKKSEITTTKKQQPIKEQTKKIIENPIKSLSLFDDNDEDDDDNLFSIPPKTNRKNKNVEKSIDIVKEQKIPDKEIIETDKLKNLPSENQNRIDKIKNNDDDAVISSEDDDWLLNADKGIMKENMIITTEKDQPSIKDHGSHDDLIKPPEKQKNLSLSLFDDNDIDADHQYDDDDDDDLFSVRPKTNSRKPPKINKIDIKTEQEIKHKGSEEMDRVVKTSESSDTLNITSKSNIINDEIKKSNSKTEIIVKKSSNRKVPENDIENDDWLINANKENLIEKNTIIAATPRDDDDDDHTRSEPIKVIKKQSQTPIKKKTISLFNDDIDDDDDDDLFSVLPKTISINKKNVKKSENLEKSITTVADDTKSIIGKNEINKKSISNATKPLFGNNNNDDDDDDDLFGGKQSNLKKSTSSTINKTSTTKNLKTKSSTIQPTKSSKLFFDDDDDDDDDLFNSSSSSVRKIQPPKNAQSNEKSDGKIAIKSNIKISSITTAPADDDPLADLLKK